MGQEVRGKTDELRLEMDLLATAEGSHGGVAGVWTGPNQQAKD